MSGHESAETRRRCRVVEEGFHLIWILEDGPLISKVVMSHCKILYQHALGDPMLPVGHGVRMHHIDLIIDPLD